MGLAVAPAYMQKSLCEMMDDMPGKVVLVYSDDIITFTKAMKERFEVLQKVLSIMPGKGFRLNRKKCEFLKDSVDYLGFHVTANGYSLSTRSLSAFARMIAPTNRTN